MVDSSDEQTSGDDVIISVIDSHTGGEPTRVITGGFPGLTGSTVSEKRDHLAAAYLDLASLIVSEPRGNEAMVAALLVEPVDERCVTGVIFFDRSAVLGMCGHGTIGLVETLRFLDRIDGDRVRIETPVGVVQADLNDDGTIAIANVDSYRIASDVKLDVPSLGRVVGDVAYGGNTFFLVTTPSFELDRPVRDLLTDADAILVAAHEAGFDAVDHVELFGRPKHPDSHSASFVLCPSGTYDRSPCGTGTSAKVACLAADGNLAEDETWVQESVTGSQFKARFSWVDRASGTIAPTITGSASVVAMGELMISADEIGQG